MTARVHFVIGAPGSGKSVVAGFVAARLPDFVVLDMDVLLDPVGALVGVDLRDAEAAHLWPAYNEVWVNLAAVLAKNRPVLLLGPLQPAEVEVAPSRSMLDLIEWAALDCADETRRSRLLERRYEAGAIEQAIADGAATRSLGLYRISTDGVSPEVTASGVADWALSVTS